MIVSEKNRGYFHKIVFRDEPYRAEFYFKNAPDGTATVFGQLAFGVRKAG